MGLNRRNSSNRHFKAHRGFTETEPIVEPCDCGVAFCFRRACVFHGGARMLIRSGTRCVLGDWLLLAIGLADGMGKMNVFALGMVGGVTISRKISQIFVANVSLAVVRVYKRVATFSPVE